MLLIKKIFMFYIPWDGVLCPQINRYKSSTVKYKNN